MQFLGVSANRKVMQLGTGETLQSLSHQVWPHSLC